MNTWNVIFLSINFGSEIEINDSENPVFKGTESFKKEILDFPKAGDINFSLLEFKSSNNVVKGIPIFHLKRTDETNELVSNQSIDFDCYLPGSYSNFFNCCIKNEGYDNKYMIIFLAHSFGAGFFGRKLNNPAFQDPWDIIGEEDKFEYFTTIQLRDSIKKSFGDKRIDCFLALNCSLQSIETNIIFKETTNLLIASQQPLYPAQVFFKDLFTDMTSKYKLADKLLFTKFLHRSYKNYYKEIDNKFETIYSLTLTEPPKSELIRLNLNLLASKVSFDEIDNKDSLDTIKFRDARRACKDPTPDDQISILDSEHFFLNLINLYSDNDDILQILNLIYFSILQIKLAHLSSFNNFTEERDHVGASTKCYISSGLGIFMPQKNTKSVKEILIIYKGLYLDKNDEFTFTKTDFERIITNSAKTNKIIDEIMKNKNFQISKIKIFDRFTKFSSNTFKRLINA